jgi:hypothetical protein
MKIKTLLEATAADLFRKMDALDAMINDPSTTQGEKDNARASKEKIAAKLAKDFPDAKRPPKSSNAQSGMSKDEYDFWSGMAKAAKASQEKEELKQKDPEEYKKLMRQELEAMKTKLKSLKKNHLSGNVETAHRIKVLSQKIENFMAREFPDEYKELQTKRDEANYKAFLARSKKAREKEKAEKDKLKKSGFAKASEVGKEYADALQVLHKALEGVALSGPGFKIRVGEKNHWNWKTGHGGRFIMYMPQIPTGKIREAWNSLDSDTQQQLRDAISKVNTQGWKHEGMTEVQKNKILTAMTPYVKK